MKTERVHFPRDVDILAPLSPTKQARSRITKARGRLLAPASSAGVEPSTDLTLGRHITIVTTASLPWMTGTAVNPTLRAMELCARGADVVLALPWLPPGDQGLVFKQSFAAPDEQEAYVRAWLAGADGGAGGGGEGTGGTLTLHW